MNYENILANLIVTVIKYNDSRNYFKWIDRTIFIQKLIGRLYLTNMNFKIAQK